MNVVAVADADVHVKLRFGKYTKKQLFHICEEIAEKEWSCFTDFAVIVARTYRCRLVSLSSTKKLSGIYLIAVLIAGAGRQSR